MIFKTAVDSCIFVQGMGSHGKKTEYGFRIFSLCIADFLLLSQQLQEVPFESELFPLHRSIWVSKCKEFYLNSGLKERYKKASPKKIKIIPKIIFPKKSQVLEKQFWV